MKSYCKNSYIGRTFIKPSQKERMKSVRIKLNPIADKIKGKRVVIIDDSIVRGTTVDRIVTMLREAGAKEVHMRISSPPFMWPCYYGTDIPSRESLLPATIRLKKSVSSAVRIRLVICPQTACVKCSTMLLSAFVMLVSAVIILLKSQKDL